jgi:hypothetical protein
MVDGIRQRRPPPFRRRASVTFLIAPISCVKRKAVGVDVHSRPGATMRFVGDRRLREKKKGST